MIARATLILSLLTSPALAGPLPVAEPVFAAQDPAQVALGHLLFYDPVLSGSGTVSCASCHHPDAATADALSLGLGDGARGVGTKRKALDDNRPEQRIPRNAPALFNLGADEFTVMFHDGRLEADPAKPNGIRTPLGDDMVAGFASVLSAQAMFPVLSPDEMAGHYGESDVSRAVRTGQLAGPGGAWDIITARVDAIPEYRARFDGIIGARAATFPDIANAIAAFIAVEWRADDSPFDRHLRDGTPLPDDAARGMALFYGKAGCDSCHAGRFQTDHDFHAIAMPQIGPGKAERFESHHRDLGRMRVTGRAEDAYRFRTPSLRNVALTAPYGHAGAFGSLRDVLRHHLDPVASLMGYDPAQAVLPDLTEAAGDFQILSDAAELQAIAEANELPPQALTEAEIDDLLAFLHSLTDERGARGRLGVPTAVPSGLPLD
ncbi:cytochrome-c peroxidase [Actibacterium ureilyticum]|uniref:cytochrome-c peroxidase n=1 Tax=Actibacterium ureilyticum TaxID=1590614 RepID=UPI000BAAB02C|nr:cytochrome c peroxidase [Actibacterium ureilyticum]